MPIERINQMVNDGFEKAPKLEDGSITRKEGIKILQNIFKNEIGMFGVKTANAYQQSRYIHRDSNEGYGYGFGYGFGFDGILSQYKDLFDLYMDEDTDGGKNITKEEQKEIKETVDNWEKMIKHQEAMELINKAIPMLEEIKNMKR